jgi:hypothetical protein
MVKKPDKIYDENKKKFVYDKPEGWDKKPPIMNMKEFKPKWWQILKDGLLNVDMEPKYFLRYEGWMHELKIVCITVFVTFSLAYMLFRSSLMSTSAMNDKDNEKQSWFDKGMDYVMDKYDELRGIEKKAPAPVKIDTILIEPMAPIYSPITEEQLDSIIASYKLDSIAHITDSINLGDSLNKIK